MYPVNLKAAGLRALVIGGGHVALRKVKKLIAEGADVTILAPEVVSDIEALSEAKRCTGKNTFSVVTISLSTGW